MFLRNYWYVAATADELGRKLLPRWVLGEPVVLYRTQSGKPAAMEDGATSEPSPLNG